MNWKRIVKLLLFLLILISWWTGSENWALAQSIGESNDFICAELSDSQEMFRRLTDYELLLQLDKIKDERITNLEKEVELGKREIELKDRIIAIKDMEIQAQQWAFDDMKEVTDRALKLAETSKPKTNWGLIGTVLLTVFTLGLVIGM